MTSYPVIEHGTAGRTSRWLRANRVRLAVAIAALETVLVVANVLQWRWALLIAAAVFAFYFFAGRKAKSPTVRELARTGALSQLMPVLAPIALAALAAVAITIAMLALIVLAVVMLALLFVDRR